MDNAGMKIECTVSRQDGSVAQRIVFEQNGLTYAHLLELQAMVVTPAVEAVMTTVAGWDSEANAKAAKG
jgi:hypothetical protein